MPSATVDPVPQRDAVRWRFLAASGYAGATTAPLAQDASFRRYWRLTDGPTPAVLMDAPPPAEDIRPFIAIAATLQAATLSVPQILAADPAHGLLLLEDFGDTMLPTHLTPANQTELYDVATDALAILGRLPAPALRWMQPEMATATAATFLDWWWPATFGAPPAPHIRTEFAAALHAMLAPLDIPANAIGLTHRDYFAGNLCWLADRSTHRRIGILDFQDAAAGHPAYDLVSLVQDARRDLPASLAERQITRLLAARPELNPADFRAAFAICAAQRHLRVAALWVRLDRRDHKPAYLAHGPRCWSLLAQALTHPATAPLSAFLDRHVPLTLRRNPA